MSESNLKIIERLAWRAPRGGSIVEVGSFCGRSAAAWAASAPETKIYCIDTWTLDFADLGPQGVKTIGGDHSRYRGTAKQTFDEMAKRFKNIIPLQGSSTTEWNLKPADLVFIDGDHGQAAVTSDLEHWSKRLSSGGLLCGDDFRTEASWITVIKAVTNFALARGYDLFVPRGTTIWVLFTGQEHMQKWWL
jgi:predicted O-methyltransferase YrrM